MQCMPSLDYIHGALLALTPHAELLECNKCDAKRLDGAAAAQNAIVLHATTKALTVILYQLCVHFEPSAFLQRTMTAKTSWAENPG